MSDYRPEYVPGGCFFFTVDYVHYNPVKHGYARRPGDWRWSSFERAQQRGWYTPGWGELDPPNLAEMRLE